MASSPAGGPRWGRGGAGEDPGVPDVQHPAGRAHRGHRALRAPGGHGRQWILGSLCQAVSEPGMAPGWTVGCGATCCPREILPPCFASGAGAVQQQWECPRCGWSSGMLHKFPKFLWLPGGESLNCLKAGKDFRSAAFEGSPYVCKQGTREGCGDGLWGCSPRWRCPISLGSIGVGFPPVTHQGHGGNPGSWRT